MPRAEGAVNFPACANWSPIQETTKQLQKNRSKGKNKKWCKNFPKEIAKSRVAIM